MELIINRQDYTDFSTIGEMLVDGKFAYYTLELPWNNGANLHNKNCILPGRYEVIIDYSPHHLRNWPHILNVPGRDNIRIDIANYPREIRGCIAIGLSKGIDFIGNSGKAWRDLYGRLEAALLTERVFVTISNGDVK